MYVTYCYCQIPIIATASPVGPAGTVFQYSVENCTTYLFWQSYSDIIFCHTNPLSYLYLWHYLPMKLAGSTCEAKANTLRSSVLSQCYSVAKYCWPLQQRSAHVNFVDGKLHFSMHLISGNVQSTPLPWLSVVTNIEQLALRVIS